VSEKPKLALGEALGLGGLEVIVGVGGAVVSTVTSVVELSRPLQLLWTGVTEYLHDPSGTDVSLQLVPATTVEQLPDAIVCFTSPAES
jgi:hypothetical protein